MTKAIRVFVVDDHEIVRRGVAALLDNEPDIEIVGEAGSVAHARPRIAATAPDIALLDMRLPDGDGIDLCRDVRSQNPDVRCIILTAHDDDEAVYAAVLAGASGYVLKDMRSSALIDAVRAVAAGRQLLDPAISRMAVTRISARPSSSPIDTLNPREREILELIAEGMTNRQIGETLALAEKTVKNYVSSLLAKLGIQRRTQAVAVQFEYRSREGE
ncbi:DNA-binding NarL/FixJ family response regulator [Mycetocola sp. CAN_C7]|uniref:response regulator n=1 Tax=Mycetocola sp. CAN_C7 TaxID=2787724 RepID=UPI0018C9ECAF